MVPLPPPELVEEIYEYKRQKFDQDETFELSKIEGAYELMAFLVEERGCQVAVVTGSTIRNAHHRIGKGTTPASYLTNTSSQPTL